MLIESNTKMNLDLHLKRNIFKEEDIVIYQDTRTKWPTHNRHVFADNVFKT